MCNDIANFRRPHNIEYKIIEQLSSLNLAAVLQLFYIQQLTTLLSKLFALL